jgi:hypothetical protein
MLLVVNDHRRMNCKKNVYTHFKYLERIETEIKYIKNINWGKYTKLLKYSSCTCIQLQTERKNKINEGYGGVEG